MTAGSRTAGSRAAGSFLDQVEDSTQITHGAKVQVWGGPETGKSHDAYENLPRPLIVVDADVSSARFTDDRFEGFKRLGPDKIPDVDALVAFLEEFVSDAAAAGLSGAAIPLGIRSHSAFRLPGPRVLG